LTFANGNAPKASGFGIAASSSSNWAAEATALVDENRTASTSDRACFGSVNKSFGRLVKSNAGALLYETLCLLSEQERTLTSPYTTIAI
jgi:hypothetical protein